MNRLFPLALYTVLSASSAVAETVVPLNGQTSPQTQLDVRDCRTVAAAQMSQPPTGDGAAVGAAVGAVEAQMPGRQHDEFYQGESAEATRATAYSSCLQSRGYQVNP